jgi:hypothetical protein
MYASDANSARVSWIIVDLMVVEHFNRRHGLQLAARRLDRKEAADC